jgi:hypothetical protein
MGVYGLTDMLLWNRYQVYLGNNRAVFDMGHRYLSRSDPRFWGEFPLFQANYLPIQTPIAYVARL